MLQKPQFCNHEKCYFRFKNSYLEVKNTAKINTSRRVLIFLINTHYYEMQVADMES